jgi:hypothetical protein
MNRLRKRFPKVLLKSIFEKMETDWFARKIANLDILEQIDKLNGMIDFHISLNQKRNFMQRLYEQMKMNFFCWC